MKFSTEAELQNHKNKVFSNNLNCFLAFFLKKINSFARQSDITIQTARLLRQNLDISAQI